MLDDYAFFVQGLLDLYESTFEFRYLDAAVAVTRKQRELLEDPNGGFFASAHEDAAKLIRMKDDYDGAEPAGNSVALMNLLRLFRITGRAELDQSARKLLAAFQPRIAAIPSGMPQLLAAVEFDLAPQREIVVAGPAQGEMIRLLWENFDPNRVLLHAAPEISGWQPAVGAMQPRADQTTVYVCEDFACQQPVTSPEDFRALLR